MRIVCRAGVLWLFLLAIPVASPYIRNGRFTGAPYFRTDFKAIPYELSDDTAAGMRNRGGVEVITADSNPVMAFEAAQAAWANVPVSDVAFAGLQLTNRRNPGSDGHNILTFSDTDVVRSIVGEALAVTLLRSDVSGELTDTDIVFNPAQKFSTTLAAGTFDIAAVATHELGHALGLDHSGIAAATMYAAVARADDSLVSLTADEIAFLADIYPSVGAEAQFGNLTGRVQLPGGQAVRGALVMAQDLVRNTIVGGITDPDGSFRIGKLPPGQYRVYAEPLDGPLFPDQLSGPGGTAPNLAFRTDFAGGRESPATVSVSSTATPNVAITVPAALHSFNIEGAGAGPPGSFISSFVAARVAPGGEFDVEIYGDGLDQASITAGSLSILGSGVNIVGGSFRKGTIQFSSGAFPLIAFRVRVDNTARLGLASVAIATADETVVLSGGLEIAAPRPTPAFSSSGVVHAATFQTGALAPGEIFSIFGQNLGPAEGGSGGIDATTGRLATRAAGVSVMVGGFPAPLYFVSAQQINAQVPFEIAPFGAAGVNVSYRGETSASASVPVAASRPGLFQYPGQTQAIVLNEDGSLNGPSNAAERGRFVILFGTGQGAVLPPLGTGELAGSSPLNFAAPTSLSIGGTVIPPSGIAFSGMTPGFAGLLQINMAVPPGTPIGDAVPISVVINGAESPAGATIAVR